MRIRGYKIDLDEKRQIRRLYREAAFGPPARPAIKGSALPLVALLLMDTLEVPG